MGEAKKCGLAEFVKVGESLSRSVKIVPVERRVSRFSIMRGPWSGPQLIGGEGLGCEAVRQPELVREESPL
jgi:hypothetical protein